MSTPHVIRLRGPWKCEACDADTRHSAVGNQSSARLRHTRRFNSPTNLEPHERVWLVCESLDGPATISLNGSALGTLDGPSTAGRFDVTEACVHNVLAIEMSAGSAADSAGFPGEVRLEIGHAEHDA